MEIYQLKSLFVLAEEGSLRPAASRLFISPSTLSGHIKSLEGEFGIRLFDRTKNGMLLTDAGEAVFQQAETILRAEKAASTLAKQFRSEVSGLLRVGIINDGDGLRIAEIAEHINRHHPLLQLHIVSGTTGNILSALEREELDVGFAESETVPEQFYAVAVDEGHPILVYPTAWVDQIESLDWKGIAQLPWAFVSEECSYFKAVENEIQKVGVEFSWKYRTDHSATSLSLAEKGLAITVVDRKLAAQAIESGCVRCWSKFGPTVPIHLVLLASRKHENPLQAFAQATSTAFSVSTLRIE